MKNLKTLAILLFMIISIAAIGQRRSLYKVVYEADREGVRQSGNLDSLLAYVNNGNPIRIGWELVQKWPDTTTVMTHWTDAGFITTLRGHVFAQIRGIFGQGFAHIDGPPAIFLNSNTPNAWVAVIGTDGMMRSKFHIDEWMADIPKEELRKMEKTKVKTMWAVMIE